MVAVVGDLVVEEDLVASGDLAGIEDLAEDEVEVSASDGSSGGSDSSLMGEEEGLGDFVKAIL